MNAKERYLNVLTKQPVDRPPLCAAATGITVELMEKVGVYWPEAHTDVDQLVTLAESIWLHTRIENIKLPFDMAVEVEAFGATVDYRTNDTLPTEINHLYDHPDQMVVPEDFLDRGRVPTVLEAISRLRKRYDNEVPLTTLVDGPFTLAGKLFGFNNFLVWIIMNPEWVHQIMQPLTELCIHYGKAQIEAGTDSIILGEASCSGDLISSDTYRDFIMPYHTQLAENLSVPQILHICGKTTGHLPYIAQTGLSCYNFDEKLDIQEAVKHLKGKVLISGYVPTIPVLLEGTPKDVYEWSIQCLDNGVEMLTPGCAMAPHTSIDNINAMADALDDWVEKN